MFAVETVELSATCIFCGGIHVAIVGAADHARYRGGDLVQVAFPEVPVDIREIVIGHRSGMYVCDVCLGPEDED